MTSPVDQIQSIWNEKKKKEREGKRNHGRIDLIETHSFNKNHMNTIYDAHSSFLITKFFFKGV